MPGAKSKELQIRFRFKVRERTTFKEQVIERLIPIRILANPGRDCKEIALRPSKSEARGSRNPPTWDESHLEDLFPNEKFSEVKSNR